MSDNGNKTTYCGMKAQAFTAVGQKVQLFTDSPESEQDIAARCTRLNVMVQRIRDITDEEVDITTSMVDRIYSFTRDGEVLGCFETLGQLESFVFAYYVANEGAQQRQLKIRAKEVFIRHFDIVMQGECTVSKDDIETIRHVVGRYNAYQNANYGVEISDGPDGQILCTLTAHNAPLNRMPVSAFIARINEENAQYEDKKVDNARYITGADIVGGN